MQLWNFQLKISDYLGFFHLIYHLLAFEGVRFSASFLNNYNSLKGVKSEVTLVVSGNDIFWIKRVPPEFEKHEVKI